MKKEKKVGVLKGSRYWGVLIFALLLLIDMVTKVAAVEYFSRPDAPDKIEVIPGWISLCLTYNKGIAYGLGKDTQTWVKLLVIGITAAMMLVLTVCYFRLDKRRSWVRTAFVFIVAGGFGNLLDRVYYQVWDPNALFGVRDMVDLNRFGFAVCNFADFFISIGAVVLVLGMLFFDRDAIFPVGKFRKLAKEYDEDKAQKKAEKKEKAAQEKENG